MDTRDGPNIYQFDTRFGYVNLFNPATVIEVPVSSQAIEALVLEVYNLSLSIGFWNCSDSVVCFFSLQFIKGSSLFLLIYISHFLWDQFVMQYCHTFITSKTDNCKNKLLMFLSMNIVCVISFSRIHLDLSSAILDN